MSEASVEDPVSSEGQWRRVHPLTPVIRSWRIFVVVLVYLFHDGGQNVLSGNVPDPRGLNRGLGSGVWLLIGIGAAALLLAIGFAFSYLSWRFTRFRVGQEALELNTGVLFRQQRRARLDRLQSVDVSQPFVARLAGLAKLTLEVAGGSDSKIALSYLSETDATRLRAELLARAAGLSYEGAQAPQAPEKQILEVPVVRLLSSLLLSVATVLAVIVLVGWAALSLVAHDVAAIAILAPVLFGGIGVLWTTFNANFGFRVGTSPDGLRLRHGLLEQRAQTVPPGRIQAVRIQQPLLWRPAGWWIVRINVAGYAGDDAKGHESTLLPVGSRGEMLQLLALVLPDLGLEQDEHPIEVVDAGITGSQAELGYLVAPRRARLLDPIGWRRTGVRVTRQALLVRSGVLSRQLDVVLHARTQSLALEQGPLQRRLRLASFVLHSTPGPVKPRVDHLDAVVAARLLDDQAARARQARADAHPERWMEPRARLTENGHAPGESTEVARVQQLGVGDSESR